MESSTGITNFSHLSDNDSERDMCKHCGGECVTDGIFCENCHKWSHRKCAKLSVKVYNKLSNSNKPYYCADCKKSFYCNECTKYCRINQKSVKCSICSIFVHKKCTPLTGAQYDNIKKNPQMNTFALNALKKTCLSVNLPTPKILHP